MAIDRTPRGIRNHNPGNIDHNPRNKWQGLADPPIEEGVPNPRFARFVSPVYGIRALAVLLINYQDRHGLDTIEAIINRWAPPGENATSGYVRRVSRVVGVAPHAPLNLHDYDVLAAMVMAIIEHECGVMPYSNATIEQALRLAGVVPEKTKPLAKSKTVSGAAVAAVAGAGPDITDQLQPLLADAGLAIEPLAAWSPWVRVLLIAIAVGGFALVIYGRLDVRRRTGG